ncbi:MAG: flavin reductase family protein [Armatimonadetes bacterium]|nr:flavin reductase family protein [Armatimonadota bacterium]
MPTEIKPTDLLENPFKLISQDWMLITAGPPDDCNTMTASWGGVGHIWGKDVCWCVVRPVRHTFAFMERNDAFTLSWFAEEHRPALNLLGTKSGRDGDKIAEAGLTRVAGPIAGTTAFAQARLVIACRKVYWHDLDPTHFLDPDIERNYPQRDYHRMYFGEIASILSVE